MAPKYYLEFFLVRYMPHIVTDEFMNIGIVLFDPAEPRLGFCEARFIPNWQQLTSFDEDLDIEEMRIIASDIERQLMDPDSRGYMLQLMENSFSNVIQVSPRKACVTDNPSREFDFLAGQYLFSMKEPDRIHAVRSAGPQAS
jgi:Protein of unknown function (DUF3037)